ncbi:MAG: DUF1573 domain-containing protein [Kiritimatiellae bacterium]|nr:DUF1573 domain-containing protein [Kiritimatiellia bacterium]
MRGCFALLLLQGPSFADEVAADDGSLEPCLSVHPTTYCVGVIEEGGQVEVEFVFNNRGVSDVRLCYIVPECDCTLDLPLQAVVRALSEYRLIGRYTAAREAGSDIKEIIAVYTDCPAQPLIELELTATVKGGTEREIAP